MASEWIPLVFQENIEDMVEHIMKHWLCNIVDNARNRVLFDLNYEDWAAANIDDRISWASEAFERELDEIDDFNEEDDMIISMYFDDIAKELAETI